MRLDFPLTVPQGRVMYSMERIFRSAGGNGCLAHRHWIRLCAQEGLPCDVSAWSIAQCVSGLQLIEVAARGYKIHVFRDVRTDWQDFIKENAQ
jgi:hypothetical protein